MIDLESLKNLDEGFFKFARARAFIANRQYSSIEAVRLLGNGFESFYTGSEADSLFITLALEIDKKPLRPKAKGADIIPRRLYFYWDKDPPDEVAQNIEYHRALGTFQVKLFDKLDAEDFLSQQYGEATRQMFLSLGHPSAESDFIRFHAIYAHGGYYLDADEQIISSDRLFSELSDPYEAVFFVSGSGPIHSAFFGSVRNSSILSECLTTLIYNCFNHRELSLWLKTGPGPVTRAIARAMYRHQFLGMLLPSMKIFDKSVYPNLVRAVDVSYRGDARDWRVFEAQRG